MKTLVSRVLSLSSTCRADATDLLITYNKLLCNFTLCIDFLHGLTNLCSQIDPHPGERCQPNVIPRKLVAQSHTRCNSVTLCKIKMFYILPGDILAINFSV